MAARSTSRPFPEIVWDAGVLRGLDSRARAEIEAAGSLRRVASGDVLFRPGDPADAVFVVAEGECVVHAVRRGDTGASVIRRARAGELFGEEATLTAFSARQSEARAAGSGALVAEVPITVLRRALGRAGPTPGDVAARIERALKRAASLDLLRTAAFARSLSDRELEVLLDAARHVQVARGEHVYRAGDPPNDAFVIADGLVQAQTDDEGTPRVEAYLSRGDVVGDGELASREPRRLAMVASGPSWLVAFPRDVFLAVVRAHAPSTTQLEGVARIRSEGVAPPPRAGAQTTAHVFRDLYRMRVARSLLVIDQNACMRCGHCASSCASAHEDGISRLVRRGDKIVVQTDEQERAPLLVPNSCQHCKNPSCMIDCPTGAIGRDARGEVFIREDLCTGCGSCARACPWDNIQIAPRKNVTKAVPFESVAVKCDLCSGLEGGPACVASCPTQAIVRIDPNEALVELRDPARDAEPLARPLLPRRAAAWPWAVGAGLAGLALAGLALSSMTSGALAGVLVVALVLYSVAKRAGGAMRRLRAREGFARRAYVVHITLGSFMLGASVAHTGLALPANAAGALALALFITIATGAFGAIASAIVPSRLSRLERKSVLPEELASRKKEIDERVFAQLSGKSEVVKTLFAKVLKPYRTRYFGELFLALSGRTLREEERRLQARIEALLGGRKSERLAGIDELVRLVVEGRGVQAQAGLTRLLRGWLFLHLAATGAALTLLAMHVWHVVFAIRGGR